MYSASTIDQETIQTYLETEYCIHGHPRFTLRVGQPNTDLLDAHARQNANCSAFLTACNPFSLQLDDAANAARQAALATKLTRLNLAFVSGIGQHPSGNWPGEQSFLVYGLPLAAAKSLATRFEQNAFAWSGADAVPQLILLR